MARHFIRYCLHRADALALETALDDSVVPVELDSVATLLQQPDQRPHGASPAISSCGPAMEMRMPEAMHAGIQISP